MNPDNSTPSLPEQTYRSVLGKSLKRMRSILGARDECLAFVERVERLETTDGEGRERCVRELKTLAADFDRTLRVELNAADALIERDLKQAKSAVSVVSVMTERVQERLARLKVEILALRMS